MEPRQVIAHYGGGPEKVSAAAVALGVTRATLYNWINAGAVPDLWQRFIELDSRGTLRRGNGKNGAKVA